MSYKSVLFSGIDRKVLLPILFSSLVSSCSFIATSGAEVTGLSLLHDRRNSDVLVIDEAIELQSSVVLNADVDIRKCCHFNVTSYNGRVLVTGEASSQAMKDKIIRLVRPIRGIKQVYNYLKIGQPSALSARTHDALITTKVKAALSKIKNIPGFDATRIKVVTENSQVYMMGLVHEKEAMIATEMARRESGVKRVIKVFEIIE